MECYRPLPGQSTQGFPVYMESFPTGCIFFSDFANGKHLRTARGFADAISVRVARLLHPSILASHPASYGTMWQCHIVSLFSYPSRHTVLSYPCIHCSRYHVARTRYPIQVSIRRYHTAGIIYQVSFTGRRYQASCSRYHMFQVSYTVAGTRYHILLWRVPGII